MYSWPLFDTVCICQPGIMMAERMQRGLKAEMEDAHELLIWLYCHHLIVEGMFM